MKINIAFILITFALISCSEKTRQETMQPPTNSAEGTWQLQTGTLIEKGDTVVTDYTKGKSFIKIINSTHFAFMHHDLTKGKDSTAVFGAGGGRYTLKDSLYTEHLEYCTDRNWEGHDFSFTLAINADTMVQSGVEIIESEGINRVNIERYIRVRQE
jgi:hypothetical protein